MTITVTPSGQACGACVRGVDLTQPLGKAQIADIRTAWLTYHVLAFPDQKLTNADLKRFTQYFGPFGDDPFIQPIEGEKHIIAVSRAADETASIFAETWHTDWSFQATPPIGTCLYGIRIPPTGGDTLFANQHKAAQNMPDDLRAKVDGLEAIHSAQLAYGRKGVYGESDQDNARAMDIVFSEDAEQTYCHPLISPHPETGQDRLFGTAGYIIGFKDMDPAEAWPLLVELQKWQSRDEFQYRHKWEDDMLVMWDNRSLLHMATGGYNGHARLLHRTTIGAA